jgi:glycosyltransferase involved in cell wall biosynthesis
MSTSTNSLSTSPAISVIMPVLNEERHLVQVVEAILSQDYQGKFELVMALGPSIDRTNDIASDLANKSEKVRLVSNPTGKTATGLNAALSSSQNEIIVRVDGHAEIPRNYLSLVVEVLRTSGAVNVGGVMAALGVTKFEKAVAGAMRSPLGVGASKFHTGGRAGEVDTVYLGAFIRSALVAAGGFDERFIRAQDWELNHRLRERGGTVYFDPRLQVTYRPRPNIKKLAKQYFEYGRWRRVVSRKHQGTINYRYLAPSFTLLGVGASLIFGAVFSPVFLIPALIYGAFTFIGSVMIAKSFLQFFLLLAILPVMHFSWGAGFITSPRSIVPMG